jgi:hypothetical protein
MKNFIEIDSKKYAKKVEKIEQNEVKIYNKVIKKTAHPISYRKQFKQMIKKYVTSH